jgi:VanZ family protein
MLLAVLPINSPDSRLNNVFVLSIRLDYLAHFAIFIPWMIIVWFSTGVRFANFPWKAIGWIAAGIGLGAISELVQYFLPYRSFNINDLVANTMGVALGSVVFFFRPPALWNNGH